MSAGDLFQLKFAYHFGNATNPSLNIFHYRQTAGTGGSDKLRISWVANVLPTIQPIMANGVAFDSILTENLDDLTDFEFDTGVNGSGGTESSNSLPEYVCWKFQYVRTTRANRHGWKRIGGVPESGQDTGVPASGFLTALGDTATALGQTLIDLDGNAWSPRIYRAAGDRYYLKAHEVVHKTYTRDDFPVDHVSFVGISTQNTRKR